MLLYVLKILIYVWLYVKNIKLKQKISTKKAPCGTLMGTKSVNNFHDCELRSIAQISNPLRSKMKVIGLAPPAHAVLVIQV